MAPQTTLEKVKERQQRIWSSGEQVRLGNPRHAENLPYPRASFDVVLSTGSVMFAPDQEKTASELIRVCKAGGKTVPANRTPDGFIGNMLRTVGKHVSPPPGVKPSSRLGTDERLRELLGKEDSSPRSRGAPTSSDTSVGGVLRGALPRVYGR